MPSDLENSTQPMTDISDHRLRHHRDRMPVGEIGDDECSTDSGCSSGGCSIESGERLYRSSRSSRSQYYLKRSRERSTRSQERFDSNVHRWSVTRTLSSEDVKNIFRRGISPSSYSSSPSDVNGSNDSDSFKRLFDAENLRRAFQCFKITSSKRENNKEKKHAKKSPKKILRNPVSYTYVRGLSGLPTQRVPRNSR